MARGIALPVHGGTILVVEDNADHALPVQLAARRVEGDLDIRIVRDGLQAVAYLGSDARYADRHSHPVPDVVTLDLVMPGLDGFGVLGWMRDRPAPGKLPVVVRTSAMNPADETRSLTAGARAFRTKPASPDDLGTEVRRIVERWLP